LLAGLGLALLYHSSFCELNAYKEIPMPYVNIQITKGATRDQKAQLVKEVTASLVRILGKKPEHTHIVIQEIADEDWGFSGLLTDDWKKQQAPQTPTET
jgi:4-oxalocrotonate tautomerase